MNVPSPWRVATRHQATNVTRLVMCDFDGTLFRADDREPDWWHGPAYSFGARPVALDEPCVPARPGPEYWVHHAVDAARKATHDPMSLLVLVTGRVRAHERRILELLKQQGIVPAAVFFNPGMAVTTYKTRTLGHLVVRYPYVTNLTIWENENQDAYEAWVRNVSKVLGRDLTVEVHPVQERPVPLRCGPDDISPNV